MITYVVPLRCAPCTDGAHDELARYLERLTAVSTVLVADGSIGLAAVRHAAAFEAVGVHWVPVDEDVARFSNGKVAGVTTGVRHAGTERIVLADDDVRYSLESLRKVGEALEEADLVVPQNVFPPSMRPWHAHWDGARSLVNRAWGTDFPGTLAVRRSMFLTAGGYAGDVLFENLELIRTIAAAGGEVSFRPDLAVDRIPPTTRRFVEQRLRQAYDEFARPVRMAVMLSVAPSTIALGRGRPWIWAVVAVGVIAVAEAGRRRSGGRALFSPVTTLFAPLWLTERALCAWLAVASRAVFGGCPYRGRVLMRSATPLRSLRRDQRRRLAARRPRGSRRTVAWSGNARIGTVAQSRVER